MAKTAHMMLPTENPSFVLEIPSSLLWKWITNLTEAVVLGKTTLKVNEVNAAIVKLRFSNGLFSIGPRGSEMPKDFEIEIGVVVEEMPSTVCAGGIYRAGRRFWTKIVKPDDVLYEECRELWNLFSLSKNGGLSTNHMLVAAAFDRVVTDNT